MPLAPEENTADASILISVPKKRFKHAVKRNQVKRQVREAYRHNKHILLDALKAQETPTSMILAFIWLDNKIHSTEEVAYKVKKLLMHIAEEMQ
jgi:ribonuclease P protein component